MITNAIYTQVYALCQMDVNVAMVGEEFFTYTRFDASSSGNTSSIDYNTLYGICITEFMQQEKIHIVGQTHKFLQQFHKFIEPLEAVTIKFNKTIPYMLFSR